jgi:replicative DNA helicase
MAKEPKMEDEGAYQAWQERMERITGRAELIVAKQRHGATGKVFMHFDSRITKFTDLANDGFDTSYE